MQTKATFPACFSHIPQALETVAVRCTTQLLAISADPTNTDPDLFGKFQRNLNGILRSLALVEKRLPNAQPPQSQPEPGVESANTADSTDERATAPVEPQTPQPQSPPQKRPSKRDRRIMKRFRRKERKKELKRNGKKSKLVQTSEQKPPSLTGPVKAIPVPAFTPG